MDADEFSCRITFQANNVKLVVQSKVHALNASQEDIMKEVKPLAKSQVRCPDGDQYLVLVYEVKRAKQDKSNQNRK